jgi:hypothetical protein
MAGLHRPDLPTLSAAQATRSGSAARAGAAEAVSAPLVFSCRSCHGIVGDSFNFVWSSEEMNCITLNGAGLRAHRCPRSSAEQLPRLSSAPPVAPHPTPALSDACVSLAQR